MVMIIFLRKISGTFEFSIENSGKFIPPPNDTAPVRLCIGRLVDIK